MSVNLKRRMSKESRKFGNDITNIVNASEHCVSKRRIFKNDPPRKTPIYSLSSISLHPYLPPGPEEPEKMVDEATITPSDIPLQRGFFSLEMGFWDKVSPLPPRDPVYDHEEEIRSYARGQSALTMIQEDYMQWQVEIDPEKR